MAQRLAAAQTHFLFFNAARFTLGALTVFIISHGRLGIPTWTELRGGLLAGLILFGGAAFQQAALEFTTAGKAGFITGTYVILIPIYLALVARKAPRPVVWLGALSALVGLLLLSVTEGFSLAPGDGLVLGGALLWAWHVILIDRLANRVQVLRLALVQYLVCAAFSMGTGVVLTDAALPALAPVWGAVLYAGVVSVGLAYTLQLVGQQTAPPADTAIILSSEAVFAALFGWMLLGEVLSPRQLLGSALMLAGVLIAQASAFRK